MKLIDKDALVAEIEKEIKCIYAGREYVGIPLDEENRVYGLQIAKGIINTLEVRGVDLETQIEDYINSHFTEGCDGGMISDWYKVLGGVHYKDLVEIAKHFFELGLKAQKGEEVCGLK